MMTNGLQREEIRLSGDWSIFSITEKMPFLREKLGALSCTAKPAVIDLGDVDSIDVSGWQLLVMWLRSCRRFGIDPVLVNIREDLRKGLDLLGFAGEFTFQESK